MSNDFIAFSSDVNKLCCLIFLGLSSISMPSRASQTVSRGAFLPFLAFKLDLFLKGSVSFVLYPLSSLWTFSDSLNFKVYSLVVNICVGLIFIHLKVSLFQPRSMIYLTG